MKNCVFLAAIFLWINIQELHSQNKVTEQYRAESAGIKNLIWSYPEPLFQTRSIPDSLRKFSKVILAHQTELYFETKAKYPFDDIPNRKQKELLFIEIVRERVVLNDLRAIEDYSEITMDEIAAVSGFTSTKEVKRFLGIRVIKPSGAITELETDDMILEVERKGVRINKVAVPDLQKGDILEFFVMSQLEFASSAGFKRKWEVKLYRPAPVLYFSFSGRTNSNRAILCQCLNTSCDLMTSKLEGEDIVYKYNQSNIPEYEPSLFVNAQRSLPMIELSFVWGCSEKEKKKQDCWLKGEFLKNPLNDFVIKELASEFSYRYSEQVASHTKLLKKYPYSEIFRYAKELGLDFETMKDDEKVAWLYYAHRFFICLDLSESHVSYRAQHKLRTEKVKEDFWFDYGDANLGLYSILKALNLNPVIIIGTNKSGRRFKNVLYYKNELQSTVYIPEIERYMCINTIFDPPFIINNQLERETENWHITMNRPRYLKNVVQYDLGIVSPGKPLPAATSEENEHRETLQLAVNSKDSKVKCMRLTRLSGQFKLPLQKKLILFEDFYESERKAMGFQKGMIEASRENKREKVTLDELNSILQAQRAEQEKAFYEDAKEQFGLEVSQLKNFRIDSLGVRHTNPNMIYSSEFELDGIVKKAGINLILDIGKIQGPILEIEGDQRNRTLDIYRDYPYQVNYSIEVEIPVGMGYRCDDVAALNTKVENQCGRFSTTARIVGTKIQITIQKVFYRDFEPVANWPLLLEIIDASNKWKSARILFKK